MVADCNRRSPRCEGYFGCPPLESLIIRNPVSKLGSLIGDPGATFLGGATTVARALLARRRQSPE